MLKNR